MALSARISNEAASAMVDAFTTLLDGGRVNIYDGVQPATVDTTVTVQSLLVSLFFGNPSYVPAIDGVADLAAAVQGLCLASGIATWYRLVKANGDPVEDGSVGLADCNLNLDSTAIIAGATLVVDSLVQTHKKHG